MSIIQIEEANCKNCYKCIRNCELKAIKFSDGQARILEDECILCGKCTLVCPQNAKQIKSDIPQVKSYIENGTKVFVSLAPSYVAAFPGVSFARMSAAIKKLGFTGVEETAIGATEVTKEYAKLLQEKKMKNIITTCCSTTVMLVEKYYPSVMHCLAPVVSPAAAHARMMKDMFGNRIKVVFISPCISKKQEAEKDNSINNVLMFEELRDWFKEADINLDEIDPDPVEMHQTRSRLYPTPGGILQTISSDKLKNYKTIVIDGLEKCIQILDSMKDNAIEGYFIEMSACSGSCIDGPGLQSIHTPLLLSTDLIYDTVRKKTDTQPPLTENVKVNLAAVHNYSKVRDKKPDEATITAILASIGKTSEESRLNCGTCGYSTCRDKAIAVFQGKADLKMCLPYLREKAESLSNVILENTPNAIFMLGNDFSILEFNNTAAKLFQLDANETVGLPIDIVLDPQPFIDVKKSGMGVIGFQCVTPDGRTVEQSITPIPNGDMLVILKDVTSENESKRQIEKIRKETIETAQKVIDKQMRVAQEIASLLGETTGETKAALTNLKKSMKQGESV